MSSPQRSAVARWERLCYFRPHRRAIPDLLFAEPIPLHGPSPIIDLHREKLRIRAAAVNDVPLLLRFSREFAECERQPGAVVINEETLVRDGFGSQPKFRSLIAEWDGQAIGYAHFFGIYSSLKGSGIFLEDLFVREAFRGRGVGRALLCQVARIARQEGSYGIRWEVLGWNDSAIAFYKSLRCEFVDEWRQVLLEADALNRLADG